MFGPVSYGHQSIIMFIYFLIILSCIYQIDIPLIISRGECTETCRVRRRDLEAEAKQLRRELKAKDERCLVAEREVQVYYSYLKFLEQNGLIYRISRFFMF